MAASTAHIPVPQLLHRLQTTLGMTQKQLGELMNCSSRTIIRYYQRGGILLPQTYATLAKACEGRDPALAAYLSARAGMSIEDLATGKPSPLSRPAAPAAMAPQAASRPTPTSKHLADSVLCAASEAMQASPHVMRPAFAAGLQRMIELGLGAEEMLRAITPDRAAKRQV